VDVATESAVSVEAAATFSVVLAFGLHLALNAEPHRFWLLAATCLLCALLLIPQWNQRAGWLTNYWVVSGLLLGFGQELGFQEMGLASQLGAHRMSRCGARRHCYVTAVHLRASS
jgi:hypothetical protein